MRFLAKEADDGNIEYKLTLHDKAKDHVRLEELASQMRFRLYEGNGEAFYYIGVEDSGHPRGLPLTELESSLQSLELVAEKAGAKAKLLRKEEGQDGVIAELLVRRMKDQNEIPPDIRIASVGNVDAGKSSLIGVLLKGELDNGRGSARAQVFRFLHELESGRTSSVSTTVLGLDENGTILNQKSEVHPQTDIELLEKSIKTITFHDLAGHERYLKTTIFGLTGLLPDFAMLVVAANQGVLQMTKEHLGLVVSLKIPFFICLTKIDLTPTPKIKRTLDDIKRVLKIPGVSKVPMVIKDQSDSVIAALNISSQSVVPIFNISAVKGVGISFLENFLELLPTRPFDIEGEQKEFRAYIDDIFQVTGVGLVVAAMVYSGSLSVQETIQLGPLNDGSFIEARVKSIHYKRVPTEKIITGQNATFALHNIKRDLVRKGMVLLGKEHSPNIFKKFDADIYVLYHSTTIRDGYSPVIHCRSIRQSARMMKINTNVLRTGDRANVTFEFLYRPEHIREGQRIVFREGRTKGIGIITKVHRS